MSITKKEQTESIINLEFPVGLQESFIHCLKLDFDFLSDLKLEEHWSIPEECIWTTQFSNAMNLSNLRKKLKSHFEMGSRQ